VNEEPKAKGEREIVSDDGLLTLDPKKRRGTLTVPGARIDGEKQKENCDGKEKLRDDD
jgi:hypothetical protein